MKVGLPVDWSRDSEQDELTIKVLPGTSKVARADKSKSDPLHPSASLRKALQAYSVPPFSKDSNQIRHWGINE